MQDPTPALLAALQAGYTAADLHRLVDEATGKMLQTSTSPSPVPMPSPQLAGPESGSLGTTQDGRPLKPQAKDPQTMLQNQPSERAQGAFSALLFDGEPEIPMPNVAAGAGHVPSHIAPPKTEEDMLATAGSEASKEAADAARPRESSMAEDHSMATAGDHATEVAAGAVRQRDVATAGDSAMNGHADKPARHPGRQAGETPPVSGQPHDAALQKQDEFASAASPSPRIPRPAKVLDDLVEASQPLARISDDLPGKAEGMANHSSLPATEQPDPSLTEASIAGNAEQSRPPADGKFFHKDSR